MKNYRKFILLFTILLGFSSLVIAQTVVVNIKNIKTTKGQLCIALFTNQAEFKSQKSNIGLVSYDKKNVVNGELQLKIPFHAGRVGVSILDDANCNSKMDYNIIGIPREGFGFSNYYHKGLKLPVFDNFVFELKDDETKEVTVLLKYF